MDRVTPAHRFDESSTDRQQERTRRGRFGVGCKRASFVRVFYSPLQRAARTCELSGYGR